MQIVTKDDGSRWLSLDDKMNTFDLSNEMQCVLRDNGCSIEWIRYAMPELLAAATQYAYAQWGAGYLSHKIDKYVFSHKSRLVCTLGEGCEEAGVCYATAHGNPDKCGINVTDDILD